MVSTAISICVATSHLLLTAQAGGAGGGFNNTRNPGRSKSSPKKKSQQLLPPTRSSSLNAIPNPKLKTSNKNSSVSVVELPTSMTGYHRSGGGEATTYTRLPPKDDFIPPSLNSQSVAEEVTLSELTQILSFVDDDDDDAIIDDEDNVISDEEVIVDDGENINLGFDYREFEFLGENSTSGSYNYNGEDEVVVDEKNGSMTEIGLIDGGGFAEEEEGEEKEKGVPAVMRCFDRAKIYVKAGDGGNGVVAFRREKYVPFGGPSGGDGGRGGNVYVEVDGSMNSLLPFRKNIHFRAGRGSHGQGRKQAGAKGENIVVKVAPGTVIKEASSTVKGGSGKKDEGNVLLELLHPGQKAVLLPGGKGGRGNASFKSGTNKVPKIAEKGEEGPEMWLELELKLVADVGIVGAPNAGKSTLLSVISAAQPEIANYPFTTLLPNLGVVSFDYDNTMVVADLPGLLEGAHRGFGLGHEFLRHTERCSVLVHVVDGSEDQPECEFDAVRLELELFNPELSTKPFIVAYNKMDLPEAYEKWITFQEKLQARGIRPFCMSAMHRHGTHEVVSAAYELLQKQLEANKEPKGCAEPENINYVADMVKKQRNASISDFKISHDSSSGSWHVVGAGIQRFVQMTNWQYSESMRRFQHVLEACGVNKSLTKLGVKEGDRVVVGEMEMIWHDSNDNVSSSSMTKKGLAGSVKWPQLN